MKSLSLIPGLYFLTLINGSCSYTGRGLERDNIQRLNGEYNLVHHPYKYKQYEDQTPTQESTIEKRTILDKHHKYFSTADGKRTYHRKVPSVSAIEVIQHDGSSNTTQPGSKEEVIPNQGMTPGKNTIANLNKRQNKFPVHDELRQNHQAPINDKELTQRASRLGKSKNHIQARTVMPTSDVRMPLGWIPWSDASTSKEPSASASGVIKHDAPPHPGHSQVLHIVFPISNVRIPLKWIPWVDEELPTPNNRIQYGSTKPTQLDRHVLNPVKEKPINEFDPQLSLNHQQAPTARRADISLDSRIENISVPSKGETDSINSVQHVPDQSKSTPYIDLVSGQKGNISSNFMTRKIRQHTPSIDSMEGQKVQNSGPVNSIKNIPDQSKPTPYKETGSGHKKNILSNQTEQQIGQHLLSTDNTKGQKVQVTGPIKSILQVPDQSKSTPYTPIEIGSKLEGHVSSDPTPRDIEQHKASTDSMKGQKVQVATPINHDQHVPDQSKSIPYATIQKQSGQEKNILSDPTTREINKQNMPSTENKPERNGRFPKDKANQQNHLFSIIVPQEEELNSVYTLNHDTDPTQNLMTSNKETLGREKTVSKDKTTQPNNTWGQHGFSQNGSISTEAKNPKERRMRKLINGFLTGIKDATAGVLSSTVKNFMRIVRRYRPKRKPTNIHYIQPNNTQGQHSFFQNGSILAATKKPRERTIRKLINGFLNGIIKKNAVPKIKSSQLNSIQKHQGPEFTTTNKPRKRRIRAQIDSFLTGIKDIAAGAWSRKT